MTKMQSNHATQPHLWRRPRRGRAAGARGAPRGFRHSVKPDLALDRASMRNPRREEIRECARPCPARSPSYSHSQQRALQPSLRAPGTAHASKSSGPIGRRRGQECTSSMCPMPSRSAGWLLRVHATHRHPRQKAGAGAARKGEARAKPGALTLHNVGEEEFLEYYFAAGASQIFLLKTLLGT